LRRAQWSRLMVPTMARKTRRTTQSTCSGTGARPRRSALEVTGGGIEEGGRRTPATAPPRGGGRRASGAREKKTPPPPLPLSGHGHGRTLRPSSSFTASPLCPDLAGGGAPRRPGAGALRAVEEGETGWGPWGEEVGR
jgi:hypothetical protein